MRRASFALLVVALCALVGGEAQAETRCKGNRSKTGAMWLSIAHPGLGEYYLKGWGSWEKMPQKKFWLGFIPLYGWPGYLQVKSADDAYNCRTNDDLSYPPEHQR